MYNVVAKLRSGEPLTAKERAVHELAACGVLRDLHDALDRLVTDAYGWPWPLPADDVLARLVALHDARVAEEAAGHVRWLRPEYQRPRAGLAPADRPAELDLATTPNAELPAAPDAEPPAPWPTTAAEQIGALARFIAARPARVAEAAAAFAGAPTAVVERHLDTLALLGEARLDGEGRYAGGRGADACAAGVHPSPATALDFAHVERARGRRGRGAAVARVGPVAGGVAGRYTCGGGRNHAAPHDTATRDDRPHDLAKCACSTRGRRTHA